MADKIGQVIHFYPKIQVAIVKLTTDLKVGDTIKFKYHDQEFDQSVDSIQLEHQNITTASAGTEVGIKVDQPVKEKAEVYQVT